MMEKDRKTMKKALALFVLLWPLLAMAQTQAPQPSPSDEKYSSPNGYDQYIDDLVKWKTQQAQKAQAPKPPATLAACKKELTAGSSLSDSLAKDLEQSRTENAALVKERDELKKRYDDAMALLSAVNTNLHGGTLNADQIAKVKSVTSPDVLAIGQPLAFATDSIINYAVKLKEHDETAVSKYNALLGDYKDYVNRVNVQMTLMNRQQRIANALALYGAMARYATPPIQLQPIQQRPQLHCTSNNRFGTTYTDCN